jgi:hypothetical protein
MDIVERLRRINAFLHVTEDEPEYDYKLSYEAANEIERLREALRKIANSFISGIFGDIEDVRYGLIRHHEALLDIARAALMEGD